VSKGCKPFLTLSALASDHTVTSPTWHTTMVATEAASTVNGISKTNGKAIKSKNQLRRAKQKQKKNGVSSEVLVFVDNACLAPFTV